MSLYLIISIIDYLKCYRKVLENFQFVGLIFFLIIYSLNTGELLYSFFFM